LDGEVFIIFFYDPKCCSGGELKEKLNDNVKKDIKNKVLSTETGKKYIYYEIDTSD